MRGLRRDAEGSHVAEMVSEAQDLPPRFWHSESEIRIHARGRFHIGGAAYCLWALPPIDSTVMWNTPQWPTRWSRTRRLRIMFRDLSQAGPRQTFVQNSR
jgi:hypothetical protein